MVVMTCIVGCLFKELGAIKKQSTRDNGHEVRHDTDNESLIEKLMSVVELHVGPLFVNGALTHACVVNDL